MNNGEGRIRLDQNIKLCVMPASEDGHETVAHLSKVNDIVMYENQKATQPETVYVTTRDYVRNLKINPLLMYKAGGSYQKNQSDDDCWYKYSEILVKPKK